MIVLIKKIYKGNYDADVEAKTFFLYGLPLEGVDLDLWTVHPFSHTLTLSSNLDSTELPDHPDSQRPAIVACVYCKLAV